MRVPVRHCHASVAEQLAHSVERHTSLHQPGCEMVTKVMPAEFGDLRAVTFTAPQEPGIYTATATSMTNPDQSSSITITVTDSAVALALL